MNNYWLLLLCFFISLYIKANENTSPLSNQNCISCHVSQAEYWQQSDHAKAMAVANKQSIVANFNHIEVKHYGQKALFFIENSVYKVSISYDDDSDVFPIKYTFGHYPLQQYLVETEQGKLQVLPFAWDSRAKEEGGQRWYHNYSHEEVRPEDRLHWRQPLQNWNGMCADCHSDGLERKYNSVNNTFDSQFDNINIGCLSCHGDMSQHTDLHIKSQSNKISHAGNSTRKVVTQPLDLWLRNVGEKTAHWQGSKRDNRFMDNCFSCHALRSPLIDGITAGVPFLDQFIPQLPSGPNYFADGQIKEEVYVYGSFLQSKMFKAGVNCLDCHDKHTMKLKVEGNGLCLQCHSAEVFNVKEHHQHKDSSVGAQCVNCHMSQNRYMGVDDRRDHSFKIPRPDLSEKFSTPNACVKCHENQSNQWANKHLFQWHGEPKALAKSKQYLMALNIGKSISLSQHWHIINDNNLNVVSRASALNMIGFSSPQISANNLSPYLTHHEPLLRLSAATVSVLLTAQQRSELVSPLLNDALKAVRVAAARSLVSTEISANNQSLFTRAFNELLVANEMSSWRGEGRVNQASLALEVNDMLGAEKLLQETIEIEPYYDAGYINLADLYRSQKRNELVVSVLKKGLKKVPLSGSINYSYGLHLVRQQKFNQAVGYFQKAMQLRPDNAQYAYTYVLALDGLGNSQQGLEIIKTLINEYKDKGQLKELGLYLSQKVQSRVDYEWFSKF